MLARGDKVLVRESFNGPYAGQRGEVVQVNLNGRNALVKFRLGDLLSVRLFAWEELRLARDPSVELAPPKEKLF